MKYTCISCGATSLRWEGKCSNCGEWDSLVEVEDESDSGKSKKGGKIGKASAASMKELSSKKGITTDRISSQFSELDRVLGGGLVPGEVVLFSGEPGVGKSTLLLQVAGRLAEDKKILYVSGEESITQLNGRMKRIFGDKGIAKIEDNFEVTTEIEVEKVAELVRDSDYELVIVDSIQAVSSVESSSYPGSLAQVRVAGHVLTKLAKSTSIPVIIVGQINKAGSIAGPKVLEHTVDCVLYMEGDEHNYFRILRSVKNRFGATSEIGVFEMREKGFEQIDNPSEFFIKEIDKVPGSCISAVVKGSRVVFIEVQALVSERGAEAGPLRRVANGINRQRLEMLCAVLSRRGGVYLGDKDIYVNISGGVRVDSPGVDLAVCAAIRSAVYDKNVEEKSLYVGEVSLTGMVRGYYGLESVVKEAARLGYQRVYMPEIPLKGLKNIEIIPVKNLSFLGKRAKKA